VEYKFYSMTRKDAETYMESLASFSSRMMPYVVPPAQQQHARPEQHTQQQQQQRSSPRQLQEEEEQQPPPSHNDNKYVWLHCVQPARHGGTCFDS